MIGRAIGAALWLAACHHHPGFPNGALDAPGANTLVPTTADAPDGAVTVRVTYRGAPARGVAVYFQNADSSLVLGATTDANGTTGALLAAGGYVTVVEPTDGSGVTRLATFAATQPRDALALDVLPTGPLDAIDATIAVPGFVAATSYQIDTSCGELTADASGVTTGQLIGCGDAMDMLILPRDANGDALESLFIADTPVSGEPVMVSGDYTALTPAQFAYRNATGPEIRTTETIATLRGALFRRTTSGALTGGAGTNTIALPVTPSALTRTITSSDIQPSDGDHGEQRVIDWEPWNPMYALDVTSALLPAYADTPGYDPATRRVTWSERDTGARPDLVRARIHAFRDAIPDGRSWTWALVAPRGDTTAVEFPRFPPADFDFTPGANDSVGVEELMNAILPSGYEGARAHGFADIQAQVTGPSGRIVVEDLYEPAM